MRSQACVGYRRTMAALQFTGGPDIPLVGVIGASLSMVALAIALAIWMHVDISRDLVIASVRAAVQLMAVGVVFSVLFGSSRSDLWAVVWVMFMVAVATRVVLSRAKDHLDRLGLIAFSVIGGSAAMSIAVTFGFGVLDFEPISLVVIAGITIGNAMPSTVLGVNQSMSLARDHVGQIEAGLALGFDRRMVVRFLAPRAARASLIPQIERTKVVGLIALPGAMTGLLLAGIEPIEAVVIQLIIMYLIVGAATLCVVSVVAATCRSTVTDDLRVARWVTPGNESRKVHGNGLGGR